MAAVLGVFGVDWRLLIVNLINFGLLLGILWYFLYRPVIRMLDMRREKIAVGMQNAEEANKRLHDIETAESSRLAAAASQADKLISEARAVATQKEREIVAQGEATAASLISDAEKQAVEAQREAVEKSKEEVAKLVVLGMEHLMKTAK